VTQALLSLRDSYRCSHEEVKPRSSGQGICPPGRRQLLPASPFDLNSGPHHSLQYTVKCRSKKEKFEAAAESPGGRLRDRLRRAHCPIHSKQRPWMRRHLFVVGWTDVVGEVARLSDTLGRVTLRNLRLTVVRYGTALVARPPLQRRRGRANSPLAGPRAVAIAEAHLFRIGKDVLEITCRNALLDALPIFEGQQVRMQFHETPTHPRIGQ
jgi:hypothetical protein